MDAGFQKPKPPKRAMSVAELRQIVSARDKFQAANARFHEAIERISEDYRVEPGCARAFVAWLRGEDMGSEAARSKNLGLERRHYVHDPDTGDMYEIETEPGSIPPRPS